MSARHFTAVVKIIEVTPASESTQGSGYDRKVVSVPKSEKDVANIVLRDTDAEALVSDVIEHLELVQTRQASKNNKPVKADAVGVTAWRDQ